MSRDWNTPRPGESVATLPDRQDAHLIFIGRLRTPFLTRDDCPRRGDPENGPLCRAEIDAVFRPALVGLAPGDSIDLLYWMHEARRDLLTQTPRGQTPRGTFALRSPVRPNPIAVSRVTLVAIEDGALVVRGLDCLDGTPLLDIKPNRDAQAR